MKPEIDLDHFFAFYEERLAFVERTCLERIEGIILMSAYLDSLAKYRFGGSASRERFRDFLIAHGNSLGYWQRLSLWQISRDIQEERLKAPSALGDVLYRLLGSRYNYCLLDFNPDIDIEALEKQLIDNAGIAFEKDFREVLEKYDYASILWRKYRNPAIHESTIDLEVAPSGLSDNEDVPFYRHINMMSDLNDRKEAKDVWFRIPAKFVLSTLHECLFTFKRYANESGLRL